MTQDSQHFDKGNINLNYGTQIVIWFFKTHNFTVLNRFLMVIKSKMTENIIEEKTLTLSSIQKVYKY